MPDPGPPSAETVSQLKKNRIQSFTSEPLHSAAYLNDIVRYLSNKPPASARYQATSPVQEERNFLYAYKTYDNPSPRAVPFSQASTFLSEISNRTDLNFLFFTGSPSPEWMEVLVDHLDIDVRFLHSHLDFIPNAQRDWYTGLSLPSRERQIFRLLIPSIVFVGTEGNTLSVDQLHAARTSCASQLEKRAHVLLSGGPRSHGQSMFRQVNVHRGDAIVIEQVISIAMTRDGRGNLDKGRVNILIIAISRGFSINTFAVFVWSDAGADAKDIPIPDTPDFRGPSTTSKLRDISDTIEHCPVFFEKDVLHAARAQTVTSKSDKPGSTLQPLAVLPSRYGETMDWPVGDHFLKLQEIFNFQTAAACQYLDMLRKLITGWTAQIHPTGDSDPTMEFIIHFEYTKTVLSRWSTHFSTLSSRLDDHLSGEPGSFISLARKERRASFLPIRSDIDYLRKEADALIDLCESGKATIMSSFSVYSSKRAQKESSLVTQLTKTTNRITLIFLPISLVTSVFGMNFKQFGQGPLSITLWVAVSIPLLAVCVLISEWGGRSLRRGRSILLSETKH
ncbi:unnamed protein product [Alternaria alternata]